MDSLPNEPKRKTTARPPHIPGVHITPTEVPASPAERERLVRELVSGVGKLLLEAAKLVPPPGMETIPEAPPPAPEPARPLTEDEVRALPRYRPFGRKGKADDGR